MGQRIKNEKFQDNWELSVGRATSIVRILTKDYGLDAHRITASGRGEFHPVQSNDTADGRTLNRRTEIILSPNLTELYKLLGQRPMLLLLKLQVLHDICSLVLSFLCEKHFVCF